ncbi:MAG: NADP-dependent oxidoreductase, partial [Terriglobia bacterium]
MKAARIHEFGDSQNLHLEDTPRPGPSAGELLVAVRSAGVNPVDWKIREGHLGRSSTLPFTAGQDFAGTVLEAGGDAGTFAPGDRVFGFAPGSYAEFAIARVNEVAHLPGELPFATAAALPTPGSTAIQILREAGVDAGSRVLIHGAGGSVGSLAVQLARRGGASVSATALGRDIAYVAELRADPAIDNGSQRFEDIVPEADVVIDLVGGDLQLRSYDLLRRGGVLASTVGIE